MCIFIFFIKVLYVIVLFFYVSIFPPDIIALSQSKAQNMSRIYHKDIGIGDRIRIEYPSKTKLKISRRGVVDVLVYNSYIHITGMRTGFITLTFIHEQDQLLDVKYFVKVSDKKGIEKIKKKDPFLSLVSSSKLTYESESSSIVGYSDDFILFYKVKDLCEQKKKLFI